MTHQLTVYDPVIIKPNQEHIHSAWVNKIFKYEGTVKNIKYHYKNRGAKHFGKEKAIYIGFMDSSAYDNLLLQGSMIFCYIHNSLLNCYITRIVKNTSNIITSLQVAIYDDEDNIIKPFPPITYNIDMKYVDSMLITEKAYQIEKL